MKKLWEEINEKTEKYDGEKKRERRGFISSSGYRSPESLYDSLLLLHEDFGIEF